MRTRPNVVAPRTDLADRIADAVAAWQLEAAAYLTIAVHDLGTAPLENDARPAIGDAGLRIQAGPPTDEVRITWDPAPAVAVIKASAGRADLYVSAEALDRFEDFRRSFLGTTLIVLLRRLGWHYVHAAAAIDPAGRGWLFAGAPRSGKSTTSALLATRGWALATDDMAFLVAAGDRVRVAGAYEPIALRDGGLRLLEATGGKELAARQKMGFTPEQLGGRWVPTVTPDLLMFSEIHSGPTSVEPLAPRAVLAQLVRWSGWVLVEPDLAQAHLDLLGALASQVRAFRLRLGQDIFERPDLLGELIP